jgi:hypothetical protein
MASDATPYISRNPGDLLSAADWNNVQLDIQEDIASKIQTAVGQVDNVPHAGDADKLGGKTLEEIEKEIIDQVQQVLREKAGTYQRIFARVERCKEAYITHAMKACPLVDVYQLDYFLAVCATGETDQDDFVKWVNFYLYNATERRIRIPSAGGTAFTVDIEPTDVRPSRLKLSDLLVLYNVSYTDTTDLQDLELAFWDAFLPKPPYDFEAEQYCHSPWFEKCCGERRSVKELKDRGDWDKIYLKWMPRKTVNVLLISTTPPATAGGLMVPGGGGTIECTNPVPPAQITPAPTQVQVIHYDFDTFGVRLVGTPVYPTDQTQGVTGPDGKKIVLPTGFESEIKLMLLLKV